MAKATRKTKKTSTPRRSRSSSITAEEKHIGVEVTNWAEVLPENFEDAVYSTLRHYNYFYDHKESAKWAKAWVKKNYDKKIYTIFSKSEDWRISPTIGGMCRMMENGAAFSPKRMAWVDQKIQEVVNGVKAKKVELEDAPITARKKSPADIVKEQTSEFIGIIEETIDIFFTKEFDPKTYSVYDELTKQNAPYVMAKVVADTYKPLLEELTELVGPKPRNVDDEYAQLIEGYSYLKKAEQKAYHKFISDLVADAEKYMASKKATRKPRKKKVATASQQVSKVKYMSSSAEYKITSVDPTNIIGAKEVYLFNVKTRTATYLTTQAARGFEIKGTTIQNIDDQVSYKKRIRKPEDWLASMSKTTKARARKSLEELKTKSSEANGRINADTIILKVY